MSKESKNDTEVKPEPVTAGDEEHHAQYGPEDSVLSPMHKDPTAPPDTLEEGKLLFFYRPRVMVEHPEGIDDIARFELVMQPKDGKARLIIIGKKRLPDTHKHERFYGFVAKMADSVAELTAQMGDQTYSTKTRGERLKPGCRLAGEAVYALVRHKRGMVHQPSAAAEKPADKSDEKQADAATPGDAPTGKSDGAEDEASPKQAATASADVKQEEQDAAQQDEEKEGKEADGASGVAGKGSKRKAAATAGSKRATPAKGKAEGAEGDGQEAAEEAKKAGSGHSKRPRGRGSRGSTAPAQTELFYKLELPHKVGEVQEELRIGAEGRYVISIKNPANKGSFGAPAAGPPPQFSKEQRAEFGSYAWIGCEDPTLLDVVGCEVLFVGASDDATTGLGAVGDRLQQQYQEETQQGDGAEKLEEEVQPAKESKVHLHTEPAETGAWT